MPGSWMSMRMSRAGRRRACRQRLARRRSPCAPRSPAASSRTGMSFRFAGLSSTIRMGSPGHGHRSAARAPRARHVVERSGRSAARRACALGDDGRALAHAGGPARRPEVLDRPHDGTGTPLPARRCRKRSRNSKPSMPGIIRSRTTAAARCLRRRAPGRARRRRRSSGVSSRAAPSAAIRLSEPGSSSTTQDAGGPPGGRRALERRPPRRAARRAWSRTSCTRSRRRRLRHHRDDDDGDVAVLLRSRADRLEHLEAAHVGQQRGRA